MEAGTHRFPYTAEVNGSAKGMIWLDIIDDSGDEFTFLFPDVESVRLFAVDLNYAVIEKINTL